MTVALIACGVAAVGAQASSLEEIRARGVVRWGADAEGGAPYVFPDPNSPKHLIGFEVDLAQALGARLGVREEMVQNSWDGLVSALDRGSFDVILNGLEITPEHLGQIDMSRPYYAYTQQIVTRRGENSVRRPEDLRGRKVGVLSASAAQRLLEKLGGVDLRVYPGNVETCRDLKARRIDAAVMDLPIALHYAKPDSALRFSGKPFGLGYYGVGVRKGDKRLLEAIDVAILDLIASGELKKIYAKWGLWDPEQGKRLRVYEKTSGSDDRKVSTLREWRKYLPLLLDGAVVTIQISFISMALAVGLGLLLALSRLFGVAPLTWLATSYVEIIRGTPLLIQLYMIYYGLPNIGLRLTSFEAAVLGLGFNYAAYEAENYRAGIQAIPRGQMEAALSLGMTRWQALRRVVLPQAIRIVIPPISNDFIALFKDSSLVSVITMVELTKVYGMLSTSTYDFMGLGLMTAAIYFGLSYPASLAAKYVERKLRYDHR